MPATLPGRKCGRVEQAQALNERAGAAEAKTRNLIALQAEDAYLRYQAARKQVQKFASASEQAEKAAREVVDRFYGIAREGRVTAANLARVFPTVQETVELRTQLTQLQLAVNEARFRALVALADLERVTAGGVCPNYASSLATPSNSTRNASEKDSTTRLRGPGEAALRP